mgnify:CR=1 FL=1
MIALLTAILLASSLIKPIEQMKTVTEKIAGGDFNVKVNYKGHDELKTLADTINYMSRRIRDSINDITDEKNKMNALLSALPDGVIALDSSGRILFLNESSAVYVGKNPAEAVGRSLFDIWREEDIRLFFEEGANTDVLFSKEIALPPKVLKLYLVPFGKPGSRAGGLMMIIRDITDMRRLEETRTRFLGSISHELRTPLTVIKGFIHDLSEDPAVNQLPDNRRSIEIIDSETDRLARLVDELLELSRLRSRKLSMEPESVEINSLVADTVLQMKSNAERMGISLNYKNLVEEKETILMVDRDRIKQVVINLIDNAIKYTPEEGFAVSYTHLTLPTIYSV